MRPIPWRPGAALAALLLGCAVPAVGPAPDPAVADGGTETATPAGPSGGLLARYLDDQATELVALEGAEVERRTDAILLRFAADALFEPAAPALRPAARARLRSLATILNAHPQSHLIVKGHGDPAGEGGEAAQRLSEERAWRVRDFLRSEGVHPSRMSAIGFGASVPLASNATEAGRARNRRIELEIRPHDEVLRQGNIR